MKKGQGALEYLMTYGWALLIIVVVGAALYALGVLNPGTYTKSTCSGFTYFTYQDQAMKTTNYTIVLLNGNYEVNITDIFIDDGHIGVTQPAGNVSTGAKFTAKGSDKPTDKSSGDTFSIEVTIQYDTTDIAGKTDTATCTGRVQ